MSMITERATKYTQAVMGFITRRGHVTNAEILQELQKEYAELSATTVHRITARMLERGKIALAPDTQGNAMRFDANIQPHDHFQCSDCGRLRDADIRDAIRPIIEAAITDGCKISGRLLISGLCNNCNTSIKEV